MIPRFLECQTEISAPSPENPKFRKKVVDRGGSRGGPPRVRLVKLPVPIRLSQRSNCPSLSAANATKVPSGEISAAPSAPSQSVSLEKCALASGFSGAAAGRRATHALRPAASARTATHGSHAVRRFSPAGGASVGLAISGFGSSPPSSSSLTLPISLSRCFGSFARHRRNNRRTDDGVAVGRADQSGSRSRILPTMSAAVSPAKVTRPVSIS